MSLIDRVKNILLTPKTEWPKIAEEAATTRSIFVGYVLVLAAIGPVALAVHGGPVGITLALLTYVIGVAVTFVIAMIVDALAPTFGGEKNFIQSLKLAAYSYTAAWLAGIFQLTPAIGSILAVAASIYSFYTFYLGATVLKRCTPDKAVIYTIVVALCGLLLGAVVGGVLISTLIGSGLGMMGLLR